MNTQGTAVCVNDVAQLYSATEQPLLNDIGIFSYDNDDGVFADNLAVYCNNCRLVKPIAEYRFDECTFTGAVSDVADKQKTYPATSHNGIATTAIGQINNAADFSLYSHYIDTAITLNANFSISSWFKKPTSTANSRYFILGSMQAGGDLLYLDRNNGWRWGVYSLSPKGATLGTYSFAGLDSKWHHLALTYVGGKTNLYVDGVLVDTVNRAPAGTLKYIGTSFDRVNTASAQGFRAPLDEFMVFQEVLTATEINTIYQNQKSQRDFDGGSRKTVVCNNLIGLYQFEQTSFAQGITDTSSNLKNGENKGGISITAGKYCRGFDSNGSNLTSTTSNAFKSALDLDKDVGVKGTISFWYKSNTSWDSGGYNGGERILFDASKDKGLGAANKYFSLEIQSNGRLRFAFEDSADSDFWFDEPPISVRSANTWYYVTAAWNYSTNTFQLWVDGNLLSTHIENTNGAIKDLGKIVFGDNASTYGANGDPSLPSFASANGQFDEVRVYNKVLTQAEIQADMADNSCLPSLDHYEIIHDGTGLTCDVEPVTIKACADIGCSVLSADAISITLQGNGVTKVTTTVVGSATVNITHTIAEPVLLSLVNPSVTPSNATVCNNGTTNSCSLVFADSGFRFLVDGKVTNIPTQLSAKPSNIGYHAANLALQAIQTNPITGACEAALTSNVAIEMAAKCPNPTSCAGLSVNINGTNINTLNNAATLSYTPLTFNFGSNVTNSAAMTFSYPDAGRIQLFARYNIPVNGSPSGNFMTGSSNAFVVRPLGFYVNVSANPAAQNATGGVFIKAGKTFSTSISAMQWQAGDDVNNDAKPDSNALLSNNVVTPNFGNELNPETVVITNSLVAPASGNNPSLVNNTFSSFVNGVATRSDLSWAEVGILQFDANLSDNRYIGTSNVTSTVPYVGRFIPDHFVQTVQTQGTLTGTCGLGSWVYSGQRDEATQTVGAIGYATAPVLRITAYNANSSTSADITQNYTNVGGEGFMRLLNTGINIASPTVDANQLGSNSALTSLTGSLSAGTIIEVNTGKPIGGILDYTLSPLDHFTYSHDANAKIAPYSAEIPLLINSITDADGVLASSTATATPTGVEVRFGRMALANSFGPETANIAQFLSAEYFASSGLFVTNVDDNCSSYNSNNLTLATVTLNFALSGKNAVSGLFNAGVNSAIKLQAVPAGNQGQIGVTYSTFPWLQFDWNGNGVYDNNPSAIATFGLFRGNDRVIYWREVNN